MCADPLTHHFRFVFTSVSVPGTILNVSFQLMYTHVKKKIKKIKRSKGGLEPLFNEKSIGLKPTLQTPEAHRCRFIN